MTAPIADSSRQVLVNRRRVAVVGAASSIGIRPYDTGREARHLDRAPATLRELGLVARLQAADLGDVTPPPYRDFTRPPGGVRNEDALVAFTLALAERVAGGIDRGQFVLLLGGDCSIVLGALLGASRSAGKVGLAYVDAHADFATPQESATGSAASMCLAMAVGRGDSPLARLSGAMPLVHAENVVLIGRRDAGQPYGHAGLAASGVLDLPGNIVARVGASAATTALERLGSPELGGFWIHVDADVLDPSVMPAVDSPEPGGLSIEELAALIGPLVSHPRALGLELTIYDPALDADRSCATRLVAMLDHIFAGDAAGGRA